MRIVVAGGTGFIGKALARRLLDTGRDEVVATTRDPLAADTLGGRLGIVQAFAGDPLSLARAFTGADVVVQAIQFPNHPVESPRRGRTYMAIDGEGTAVTARVARAVGVKRFVYVSGIGAGQGRKQPWFRAKDLAESAIRESGLDYVIVRPSWVYGPGDRTMNRFVSLCRLPIVPVIGDGRNTVDPIWISDVSECLVQSVRRPDAAGKTFDLGGPQRLSTDEILRTIQDVVGRHGMLIHCPASLAKLGAWPLQFLPEPPLSPAAVDFILQEVEFDPKPARDFFGLRMRPLSQALREYVVRAG